MKPEEVKELLQSIIDTLLDDAYLEREEFGTQVFFTREGYRDAKRILSDAINKKKPNLVMRTYNYMLKKLN